MNKCKKIIIQILIIAMFFIYTPKTEYAANTTLKIGDINGDGAIDSRDTLRILEHIAASNIPKIKQNHSAWILTGDKLKAADINGDGQVDSRDTLKELEYIASSTIPSIAKKHPNWKKYIESKWTVEATGIVLDKTKLNIEKGKTSKLVATITPTNASNKVVTWSSTDTKIATVDGIGNVEGKNVGIAIITATTKNGKSAKCEVKITEAVAQTSTSKATTPQSTTSKTTTPKSTPTKNISNLNITLKPNVITYNGKAQTPVVTIKDGNTVLKNGTNYTLSYSRNINSGIALITITGKGNYTGTTTKTFNINKATYNMNNVKFANSTVTYDGKSHSIIATGVPAGVKVTYIGNGKTAVGTYTITAKFTGNNANYNIIADRRATLKINAKPTVEKIEKQKVKVNGKLVTKAQYANFRNVSGGKLGKNVLYRCINPIHGTSKSKGKYAEAGYYADQMLQEHNVKAILNLDNDSSSIRKSSYPKSTYYRSLFNSGKVCARAISGVTDSKSWQKKIVDRVRFFAKNEGPYAVHCWIGRDRTGFTILLLECLMDVPYENMYNDYKKSDENFRITGRFNENTISGFSKDLKIITGKSAKDKKHPKASDWKNVNFSKCAERYLKGGGMTDNEIQRLKKNLAKNY